MTEKATRTVTITHPGGLHARPCVAIAQMAKQFQSQIRLSNRRQTVNAADVLQVLTLGAPCGSQITIEARGPDAVAALDALCKLFAENFGMES